MAYDQIRQMEDAEDENQRTTAIVKAMSGGKGKILRRKG